MLSSCKATKRNTKKCRQTDLFPNGYCKYHNTPTYWTDAADAEQPLQPCVESPQQVTCVENKVVAVEDVNAICGTASESLHETMRAPALICEDATTQPLAKSMLSLPASISGVLSENILLRENNICLSTQIRIDRESVETTLGQKDAKHQQVLLTKDEEHQQELAVKETEFKQLQKKYDALNAPSWMSIFSLIFLILITLRVYNINFNDFDYEAIFYSTP